MSLISHDLTVWAAKSIGLFYLLGLSAGVLIYVFLPGRAKTFQHAAHSILSDEDRPCR